MRKLIAGMQSSVDGKVDGPNGFADWVETWSNKIRPDAARGRHHELELRSVQQLMGGRVSLVYTPGAGGRHSDTSARSVQSMRTFAVAK
jgi:hypothetical protein